MTVLITGATGNVGAAALAALRAAAVDVVAASSRADVAGARHLDFRDPATFGPALRGIRRLLLVRPPAMGDVKATLIPFVDAAWDAGVDHVVFLSVVGADQNPLLPHTRVEQHLARRGGATFLRAGFFAQNLTSTWRPDVVEDRRLFLPAGDGKVAFVDAEDLGAAAAVLLQRPPPTGCAPLDLTGEVAVSLADVAASIGAVTGSPVQYVPCSALAFFRHLWRRRHMPLAQAAILTALHVGLRKNDVEHGAARVTPTLAQLLGRPPRSMAAFIAAHADALRP